MQLIINLTGAKKKCMRNLLLQASSAERFWYCALRFCAACPFFKRVAVSSVALRMGAEVTREEEKRRKIMGVRPNMAASLRVNGSLKLLRRQERLGDWTLSSRLELRALTEKGQRQGR
jgi:hypothetical protein